MGENAHCWHPGRRFGLRAAAIFFGLVIVPDLVTSIPVIAEPAHAAWLALWAALMPILGNLLLGIEGPIEVAVTGSGDMAWHWVQHLWFAIAALVGAAIWLVIDRRRDRHDDDELHAWVRVLVRYGLALAMFGYGLAKLVGMQFGELGPLDLMRRFGDASPMGLLWTHMGHSPTYAAFTGVAEALAGALLLGRRTTTLGALVAAGVMAHVVMLNLCFDVPVKLYASILLAMALFLVVGDARRLVALFVANQATAPRDLRRPILGRGMQRLRLALKVGFVAVVAIGAVLQRSMIEEARRQAEIGPLFGAWEVESFTLDGAPRTRADDAARWRWLVVGEYAYAVVQAMRGEPVFYGFAHDREAGTVTLTPRDRDGEQILRATQPAADELLLAGTIDGGAIEVRLRKVDTAAMLLPSRGFRWVQERPFNR